MRLRGRHRSHRGTPPEDTSQATAVASAPELSDFVLVANRLPFEAHRDADGEISWERSPGGLVTALEPIMRERDCVWVGWSGQTSDAKTYYDDDQVTNAPEPPKQVDSCRLHQVELTGHEVEAYYAGFANSALWPLYHDGVAGRVYDRNQWAAYRLVNSRFANEIASVSAPGATVWIHDYHLQLVPQYLRALRPDLRIGFFLHIPFPPSELFAQLPWRREILNGLLGADLIGFQVPGAVRNFLHLADRLLGLPVRGDRVILNNGTPLREVRVADFPVSIDTQRIDELARDPIVRARAEQIRKELGDPKIVLLGVDRLDYTKGIDVRISAFAELLLSGQLEPDDAVFVQVATPSREGIDEYQRIRAEIELAIGRVIGEHARVGSPPIHYLHQNLAVEEIVAFYVAADIMLVTPLRDGMNLVAKEYVAARPYEDGALVLSEFAGAAFELTDAWIVNPYDPEAVKSAIMSAVNSDMRDRQRRMSTMRASLFQHDVSKWAHDFLNALGEETG